MQDRKKCCGNGNVAELPVFAFKYFCDSNNLFGAYSLAPLAAKALFFCLIQKNQKIKPVEMLLCRTWPLPCKSGKTGAAFILPCFRSLCHLLQQKHAMPCNRTGHHCFACFRPKLFYWRITGKL